MYIKKHRSVVKFIIKQAKDLLKKIRTVEENSCYLPDCLLIYNIKPDRILRFLQVNCSSTS